MANNKKANNAKSSNSKKKKQTVKKDSKKEKVLLESLPPISKKELEKEIKEATKEIEEKVKDIPIKEKQSYEDEGVKLNDLFLNDYEDITAEINKINKERKKKAKAAEGKEIESIYSIEVDKAEDVMGQSLADYMVKDQKRLKDKEEEENREKTDIEKAAEAVANAYSKKRSKLPIITGLIIGISLTIAIPFLILNIYQQSKVKAYLGECTSITGKSRIDIIDKGIRKYKNEIQEKIDNNEPRDDENILIKIDRFADVCEKGLDVPEHSIYYYYSIVGIGK